MKNINLVLFLLFCSFGISLAQESSNYTPIKIEAKPWVKGKPNVPWKMYDTRIVDNIHAFTASDSCPSVNKYGSDLTQNLNASGFFRAEKVGDRWWMVDPYGFKHLNISVVGFRQGKSERNKKALIEKFGTTDKWTRENARSFYSLVFSGSGAWSDEEAIGNYNSQSERPLTHTPILNFMSSYGKKRGGTYQLPGNTGYPNQCIFVFDPEFEEFCDQFASQIEKWKDDVNVIGYFSDNELPFGLKNLEGYLKLENLKDPGRIAAEQWLVAQGITAEKIDDTHRAEFAGIVAEKYFSTVKKAIRKYDKNHMYLGSRIHGGAKFVKQIIEAAGRYCEVVSINYYGHWTPGTKTMANWGNWAQKPFIITEFYTKGMDAGLLNVTGAGFTVHTQTDRGNAYQHFTLGLLESKNCVGWHWFRYQDNDPTDKTADPSNLDSNKGLVDNEYNLYGELAKRMKQLNINVFHLINFFDKN